MVKITFLGTSNAFGHSGRHTSCYLLEGSQTILIDAGYSLFSAIRGKLDKFPELNAILISHIHPDHYMGLPQMVLEDYYVIKREKAIPVFGPPGIEKKINKLAQIMYNDDVAAHTNVLFKFKEFAENELFSIPGGSVRTIPANHSGNARMQVITLDNRKLGYSGDTSYIQNSIEKLLDCDLTIVEASSFSLPIPDHITAQELIKLEIPHNKKVYLSHVGSDVRSNEDKIKPPLYLADDGLVVDF